MKGKPEIRYGVYIKDIPKGISIPLGTYIEAEYENMIGVRGELNTMNIKGIVVADYEWFINVLTKGGIQSINKVDLYSGRLKINDWKHNMKIKEV